jgi:hypothetical protein
LRSIAPLENSNCFPPLSGKTDWTSAAWLAANRHDRSLVLGAEEPGLLADLIFDSGCNRNDADPAVKRSKRYRYDVSTALVTGARAE